MPADPADTVDYAGEVNRLLLAMRVIADVNLDAIAETIRHADAIGPFVDPTAYRDALYRGDMHAIEDLARELEPAVKVWNDKIAPRVPA